MHCALQRFEEKGIYNVGSGSGVSTKDAAECIINNFMSNSECIIDKEKPEDSSITYLSVQKAKDGLGFSCDYTFENAIKEIATLLVGREG